MESTSTNKTNQQNLMNQKMGDLLDSLGVDNMGWSPAFADYKVILEQLRSKDEMCIYEAVVNLSNQLSVAQENTLSNFTLDQYIPALIEILKRPATSDISNEINMFATQCLTNLMDIFPTICNSIISHGGVKCLCELMERNMGFIDLSEACIKAFDKISSENPYAILTSGALGLCLNMMDFFEFQTQKRIIQILMNVSRHAASEQDFDDYVMPLVPNISMLLQMRSDSSGNRLENLVTTVLRICESFMRFFSPFSQCDKVSFQYQKLAHTQIFEILLEVLNEYSILDQSAKKQQQLAKSTSDNSNQQSITTATIQNLLKTFTLCCRFSSIITKQLLDNNILRIMESFLPSHDDHKTQHYSSDHFPYVIETIQLMDAIFPEREDALKSEAEKLREPIESEKRKMFMQNEQNRIVHVAEKLLPRVFYVYENNITSVIRIKTLQIIDKMISLFNEELLNNFIEPYSFSKFIYSNFRSQHLASIQLCLQMVQKLIQSNPKTYTLPLMREGVSEYVKKLQSQESIEKNLNIKIQLEKTPVQLSEEEATAIFQAKAAILGAPTDDQQKQRFETLQRYLEAARQTTAASATTGKSQVEICKSITTLAQRLCKQYFENEDFLKQINEHCEEEFQLMKNLKKFADQIKEQAGQVVYNPEQIKALMKQLGEYLTSKRHIMCYEFNQSGLLEALDLFLTYTPTQAKLYLEMKKAKEQGEELKRSEEMQINTRDKKVSKKEARCFIQRLKVFTHCIMNTVNEKKPFNELVSLCHDILSQSEQQIFEAQLQQDYGSTPSQLAAGSLYSSGGLQDINASVTALKQLTRRIRVNLVYDPKKTFLQKEKSTKEEIPSTFFDQLSEQTTLTKAKSSHPAFAQLGQDQDPDKNHSKVFIKRNFLYKELKQVLISVEQCASLWLLEDFLRNKIKSSDDVKALKMPSTFLDQIQKTQKNPAATTVLNRAMDKMREIFDSDRARQRSDSDELAQVLSEEILNSKDLTEEEQADIIRQLEIQTLQMMDEMYAGEDSPLDELRENYEERLLSGGSEEEIDTEQKLYDFQRTIEKLRQTFREKQQQRKEQLQNPKDHEMDDQSEEVKKDENEVKDVEMTDEEEDQKKEIEEIAKKYQLLRKQQAEVEIGSHEDVQQHKEVISQDLEELIKANGEDIEYEFYFDGQVLNPNTTLFEVLKNQASQNQAKAKAVGGALYNYYGQASTETSTVYFTIKDKNEDMKMSGRKDSIMEFANKRERTRSEAVDDISVSSVNFIVQQFIDKEFQVFSKDLISKKEGKGIQDNQLEQSLKILKVLNFICKNIHLLGSQGIQFLIKTSDEEENKEEGFTDLDLQIAISNIHPNIFHHHKLDSYIMKNIQDPYNLIGGVISDTLQQIFRNCPFLFPFQTRELFFKLISFIGAIDMNRSIYFLKQYLKQRGGKLPEDKSSIKMVKQKAIIDRSRIYDSAISLIKQINKRAFLEIEYKDEQGTGLGPTLEFYCMVAEEIQSRRPDYWRKSILDNTLFPAPICMQKISNDELHKVYEMFRLAGILMAKSIVDDRLIDLPISPLWWDLLLGRKMNLFDLDKLDQGLFKVFADLQLLANKKREIDKSNLDQDAKLRQIHSLKTQSGAHVEDLSLYFTLPGFDDIELKPNGKETLVTIDNLQEFIDLFLHHTFHETIKVQTSAFKKGFNSIFPIESLKAFSTLTELEDMICGTQRNEEEWKSVQRLTEVVTPAHGYHLKSKEYLNFIRFMTELEPLERRKFLKFVTGSPRLPNGGFGALDPKLTVVMKKTLNATENPDLILPSVMTCQNYVKLPCYSSYEALKLKFEFAYNEGRNNFTLS